jgi:Tol biopolymer transport system component
MVEASRSPALSGDGRYVAFASTASNLLVSSNGTDTNQAWDVYVRDRSTGTTVRASVSTTGAEGNGHSFEPTISADGALVAFASYSSNLVSGDTNEHVDIFLRHMTGETTVLVSTLASGQFDGDSFHPSLSGDGYRLAFDTIATNVDADTAEGKSGVFVCDLSHGTLLRCSVANDGASANDNAARPAQSLDGRWVAFSSSAWNLLSDDTNAHEDVFVRGPIP